MTSRLKKLTAVFDQRKIDALLVIKDANIIYLTGFPACESWLLVSSNRTTYITDFRYILAARKGLKGTGVRVEQYTQSMAETFFKLIGAMRLKRIGISAHDLTLAQYRILERQCPKGVRLVTSNNLVEHFRAVKDADEIKRIKGALKVHKQAHQYLKRIVKPGTSEKELLLKLEHFVKSRNAGFSFDPIIASGLNSCYPHAGVTRRKIRQHEPVLIDFGIDVNGYKSDLTRMFFLGKISALIRQVNDCVYEAQQKAIAHIKAGISIAEIDFQARNYLKKHHLAKYFGHALGHGVGLEIHEGPRLAHNNTSMLKEGMVITVEPAVYIPNKFGIRIEDMVLVKAKNCEVLSDDIH